LSCHQSTSACLPHRLPSWPLTALPRTYTLVLSLSFANVFGTVIFVTGWLCGSTAYHDAVGRGRGKTRMGTRACSLCVLSLRRRSRLNLYACHAYLQMFEYSRTHAHQHPHAHKYWHTRLHAIVLNCHTAPRNKTVMAHNAAVHVLEALALGSEYAIYGYLTRLPWFCVPVFWLHAHPVTRCSLLQLYANVYLCE